MIFVKRTLIHIVEYHLRIIYCTHHMTLCYQHRFRVVCPHTTVENIHNRIFICFIFPAEFNCLHIQLYDYYQLFMYCCSSVSLKLWSRGSRRTPLCVGQQKMVLQAKLTEILYYIQTAKIFCLQKSNSLKHQNICIHLLPPVIRNFDRITDSFKTNVTEIA